MEQCRQVVVVGAGPAGSAVAYFLGRSGKDVLLLDKSGFPRDKICGDAVGPRALRVLREMGLLDELACEAHRAGQVVVRAPNHRATPAAVPSAGAGLDHIIVIPRLKLDHAILRRALAAGAEFREARVEGLVTGNGAVRGVRLSGGARVRADLTVLATGAATPLVKEAGLLPSPPSFIHAVRRYYQDIERLEPRLELYLDHVDLPGYGWVFPTGAGSANVGVGYSGRDAWLPRVGLERFLSSHPRLQSLLSRARGSGPARAYPLRVDFPRGAVTGNGILTVGEAAGLVNPITGEGIDYALESGQLAAEAISEAVSAGFPLSRRCLRPYRDRLHARFAMQFRFLHIARRVYFNAFVLDRVFGRDERRPYLPDAFLGVCFGAAEPRRMFGPRALLEMARR